MRYRLDGAVRVLCPIIEDRIRARQTNQWCEYDLRKELIGCVMGSQVRHEMAVAVTGNLEQAGLLDDSWWFGGGNGDFGSRVFDVLSGQRHNLVNLARYRFPKTRTHQLVQVRDALAKTSLTARLADNETPTRLRQNLVAAIAGLGPKQASMFLRNIGKSYDLAILDTHVIRFLVMQNLLPKDHVSIGTFCGYERVERTVIDYANTLGYPPGYLDWAIWATMKAARELGL
jgi:N-glycosylase/DNA lyase